MQVLVIQEVEGLPYVSHARAVKIVEKGWPFRYEGNVFFADVYNDCDSCFECELDSLCTRGMKEICASLDLETGSVVKLRLAKAEDYKIK